MPTYQYRCSRCGEDFELWQSIHAEALSRHPGCGGTVTRVFAPAGIVLKGSGFYRTDNRAAKKRSEGSKKEETANDAASGNGSDGGKSSSGSKESTASKESKDAKKEVKGPKTDTSKSGSSST